MSNQTHTPAISHLRQLSGIRFVAAMTVLCSHAYQRGFIQFPEWIYQSLDGGRTAVTFFFVLSGFILGFSYRKFNSKIEKRNFYIKRFARLYPVVLLSLALAFTSLPLVWFDSDFLKNWYSLTENWQLWLGVSLAAQMLMLTAWLPSARLNQPWNSPSWSISCEMFFYALFPLIVGFLGRLRFRGLIVLAAIVWIAQGLILLALSSLPESGSSGFLISQFPITHLAEFLLGVISSKLYIEHGSRIFKSGKQLVLIQLGVTVSILCISILRPIEPAYYLLSPLFAILIMSLSEAPKLRLGLDSKILVLLGESSYSLYMVHIPLINIWYIAGGQTGLPGWTVIPFSLLLSVLIFKSFESPARRFIVQKFAR